MILKIKWILTTIVIFLTAFLFWFPKSQFFVQPQKEWKKVQAVIDGDTIIIEGNLKVRYIGIDTPETVSETKPVECYGKEATEKNKKLVENKFVILQKDQSEKDKYGRLLRYVWTVDGVFVNDYLVRNGLAYTQTIAPDIKYVKLFNEGLNIAKKNKVGLWKECYR